MMRKAYYIGIFTGLILWGCDNYLDESPSKNENFEIETVEQLEALLSKNNYEAGELDNSMATMFSTDCFELTPGQYTNGVVDMSPNLECIQLSLWEMEYLKNTNENVSQWVTQFEGVYLANLVLNSIGNVSGTEEAKAVVSAKAHLLRAYNYLDLVNYYCMPYGSSTLQEPGLPLKRSTSYEEDLHRVSLEDTYKFIEEDVLEAVKLKTPLVENGVRKSWKETGATANALAARFYLTKGDYQQALNYATEALKYGDDLMDYNSGEITQEMDIISGVTLPSTWNMSEDYAVTSGHLRAYYNRWNNYLFTFLWLIPSDYLLQLYHQDYDLRYKFFIIDSFQKVYFFGSFAPFFTEDVPGYASYNMVVSNAPTVAEMILIRAECLARNGDVNEAMNVLNAFRAKRFAADAPAAIVNRTAAGQKEAIKYILEERTMEFPFTLRWYDIRRCNFNEDPDDDITVTRKFYPVSEYNVETNSGLKTYTLSPATRSSYAIAIPNAEIVAGNGVIEQNKY